MTTTYLPRDPRRDVVHHGSRRDAAISARRSSGRFYMWLPVLLLASSVGGWVVMVSMAQDDPGFAVEPRYYSKASAWEDHQAQLARNERLGWQVGIASWGPSDPNHYHLAIVVRDETGQPLSGLSVEAEAFAVARSAERRTLSLTEASPGLYRAEMPTPRSGIWELRFTARDGERVFTAVQRQEIMRGH